MRAARLVPLAGLATVVLVVIAFVVGGSSPKGDDPLAKVVLFYRQHDSDQILAAAFLLWATAAFLLFASGLWQLLRAAEPALRPTSSLLPIGAAIFAVGTGLFAGITFTLGDFADHLGPQTIQALNALNQDLFPPLILGVFAFLIGAGASIITTAALPKWLGWIALVLAIAALTPVGFFAFFGMGIWILLASALILARGGPTAAPAQAAAA